MFQATHSGNNNRVPKMRNISSGTDKGGNAVPESVTNYYSKFTINI